MRLRLTLALAVLLLGVAVVHDGGARANGADATCAETLDKEAISAGDGTPPAAGAAPDAADRAKGRTGPTAVDVRGQETQAAQLTFPFGWHHAPMVRHQTFQLPPGMDASAVAVAAVNDLQTAGADIVPPGGLVGRVVATGPGPLATVAVCIDPNGLVPGSYAGGLLVGAGSRMTPLSLQATVKDQRWWLAVLAALVGATAGLFVKLFADQRSWDLPGVFGRHVLGPPLLITLGAGATVCVYSYLTIYADDPTFGCSAASLWRITAETFAGTLAAKAITDLARRPSDLSPASAAARTART
jgi:hypothetical protein